MSVVVGRLQNGVRIVNERRRAILTSDKLRGARPVSEVRRACRHWPARAESCMAAVMQLSCSCHAAKGPGMAGQPRGVEKSHGDVEDGAGVVVVGTNLLKN